MLRLIIIMTLLALLGCAPQFSTEKAKLLHRDQAFEGAVQEGRSLLVFPVIMDTHFVSLPTYEELSKPLNVRHDRLILTWYMQFRSSVIETEDRERLLFVEDLMLHERSLEIPRALSFYEGSDFRFIQVFRVRNAYTVTNEKGEIRKHLTLEGEVWDVRKKGVVWRAESIVETGDHDVDDHIILLRAVELLYETLPKFYFNSMERNW